ncbi:MAG: protein phosphatase 2C domain-containing protein [Muribaculaceae bacterium]|nr:protein phosphatase 2C domain-containing protein [Muribaculaceae bacterium]
MKYILSVYQIQEYGQRKDAQGNPHQEDSMYPLMGEANPSDRLFIVCDGMGGHDAGEVASATVCEAMSQSILAQQPDPEGNFTIDMLNKALDAAFNALDARDTGAEKKMGTTMTLLKLYDHGAMIAHMGDSRIYHIRPGKDASSTKILHQTWDHSLVNDLVKIGELTPEEARTSRQRNVITRAMQPHYNPRPKADVYHTVDIKPGDIFYLCTDGMLENMEDEQIKFNFSHEAGNTERKRSSLISATELNRDNHTAIIVEILDVIDPLPVPEVTKPIAPVATISDPDDSTTTTPRKVEATKQSAQSKPSNTSNKSNSSHAMVAVIVALTVALIIVLVLLIRSYSSDKAEKEDNNASKPAQTEIQKPDKSASDISVTQESSDDSDSDASISASQLSEELKDAFDSSDSENVDNPVQTVASTVQTVADGIVVTAGNPAGSSASK